MTSANHFERITLHDATIKYGADKGIVKEDLYDFDRAKATAERLGIEVQKSWGLGSIVNAIFEEVAEHHLIQPTFLMALQQRFHHLHVVMMKILKQQTVLNYSSVDVKLVTASQN